MSPRKNFNDGQEIIQSDLIAVASSLEIELYDRILYELLGRQQSFVFGNSFAVSYVNATTVSVGVGNGQYYDSSQVDPEPMTRPLYIGTVAVQKTITTPSGANNRIDLVVLTPARANIASQSRNYKDPNTGVVSSVSMVTETDWLSTLSIVAGTPAGSPVAPSTPAGSIALAQLLVTQSSGIANQSAITDVRTRRKKGSSWRNIASKSAAYTMDFDDEMIVCDATGGAFSVTLLPVASMSGKVVEIVKKDSSVNVVTIQANAAELIMGLNTQPMALQYDTLRLWCDGTAWYIT